MSRAALVALVASWSVPALAQEEAVRFRYEAADDCPSAEAFTARVRQRTARGREAAPEEMARTFAVQIRAEAPGFTGSIEFLDDQGTPVSRRVHGEECDAVVSSLALITALALDATLREEPSPEDEAPAPAAKPRAPQPVALTTAAPAIATKEKRPEEPWLESARVGLGAAYDPSLSAPSFGLIGQLDFRNAWALRLFLHYEETTIEVDSGREVGVRLLGLESSVCPTRWSVDDFAVQACAAFDLGSLRARGIRSETLVSVRSETRVWAALGPELRLAWEPREAFWAELRGELSVPFFRRTFALQNPPKTAYDIPVIYAQAGICAGVRFW